MIDMENLLQLLDTPGKVNDAPNATDLALAEGGVEFRDVVFGYERGVPVLKGVSHCAMQGVSLEVTRCIVRMSCIVSSQPGAAPCSCTALCDMYC